MISSKEKKTENTNRIIHHVKGKYNGPTIVFFAGIHGNEKAGVIALKAILPKLNPENVYGEIFGVYGNIKALKENKRYIDIDLNRIWTTKNLNNIKTASGLTNEQQEQRALYDFIITVLQTEKKAIYFIDLHTTSSKTLPFITINDAIINRKFSYCFPVPIVLGIEEYLDGPLLSYLNKSGYVSLGFEAGQHTDETSVKNCKSFIYLAITYAEALKDNFENLLQKHFHNLKKAANNNSYIYEVVFKYHIEENEAFKMKQGFKSFQTIKKGELLATSNNAPIYSPYSYELFMPLYQRKGNDGFFIIKKIPKLFLKASTVLRRLNADQMLTLLPGVSWHNKHQGVLKANLNITRFLAKSIFHLFGYRSKKVDNTQVLLFNRERIAKNESYKKTKWY